VGVSTIVEFLNKKGCQIKNDPNQKIDGKQYDMLVKEFNSDIMAKKQSEKQAEIEKARRNAISAENKANASKASNNTNQAPVEKKEVKVLGTIDLDQNRNKFNSNKPQQKVGQMSQQQDRNKKGTPQDQDSNGPKVLGKIDLSSLNTKTRPDKKSDRDRNNQRRDQQPKPQTSQQPQQQAQPKPVENAPVEKAASDQTVQSAPDTQASKAQEEVFRPGTVQLTGPTILGKIELGDDSKKSGKGSRKKKRNRIGKERVDVNNPAEMGGGKGDKKGNRKDKDKDKDRKDGNGKKQQDNGGKGGKQNGNGGQNNNGGNGQNGDKFKRNKDRDKRPQTQEVSDEDVAKQVKDTLARLTGTKGKSKTSKHRRDKREDFRNKEAEQAAMAEQEKKTLKVTEFISANELATLMDVPVNQIIATCFDLGTMISINQRLDAEIISLVAPEFGFDVQFINAEEEEAKEEEVDNEEDLEPRSPIVTVMGHVDHGKTSLLDYIRKTNVIAGEAGGITQHIGAYNVTLSDGKKITFLDTPGHEAFTAMRARGAKITDIAVIVIAADDSIMPQTEEAISHAQAAGVPIIFAINKIDKPGADPDKIKTALSQKNLLVEDWGGKYGSVDISAKKGLHVDDLLERILLEAEMLELKANFNKPATGTVIESALDKGRGYVSTVLVDGGTLRVGDVIWAGGHSGKVKAMFNERNKRIDEVKPGEPCVILGLDGAPVAGDKFKVMPDERSAREKALQRQQIEREIGVRTKKHLTLEEIGRRIAIGSFQELNIIIKGDVQGSIEALQDSLIRLSTEEIQVNVVSKAVGQISESDVLLASASNAIIIGFQVRPSGSAKKLAEKEQIDIKTYSIIYDAIDDIKDAMEGMLGSETREEFCGTAEIRSVFRISKVGNIAGCFVTEGKILRTNKVRVIRDGIVVFTGELGSLKHFKDDVKEVNAGMECGLNIDKYNDIQEGDIVEAYEEKEIKKKLNRD